MASELPAAQVLLGLLPSQGPPHGQRLSMATRALKGLCHQRKARASRRHLITSASRFFALTRRAKAKEQGRQEARRRPGQSSGWKEQRSGPDAVHLPRPSEQAELAPAGDTRPYQTRGSVPYLPCPPCCPHSVRAAWATAKRRITDSRRLQAAPLDPAHLCTAPCVPRRAAGSGERGRIWGARGTPLQSGWLGPRDDALAHARALVLWAWIPPLAASAGIPNLAPLGGP